MATRYSSSGLSVGRSPKTSVVAPWIRRAQFEFVAGNNASVAYGSSAHTKGAWVQVYSSTASNASILCLNGNGISADTLCDIGTGAAGSESVVVGNVLYGGHANDPLWLPVAIPSGSRVALRVQGTSTSPTAANLGIYLANTTADYRLLPASLDTIGATTATSNGTALSGASGTWVEITSSTAKDYQQVALAVSASGNTTTLTPTFTLGIGAAGGERSLGSVRQRWASASVSPNALNPPGAMCWSAGPIPAGSRLSVKHDLASNPGNFNVALYGVPYV